MREFRILHDQPLPSQIREMRLPERDWKSYERTFLYRFYSAIDLLYVGVTVNPSNRWPTHRAYSVWFPIVDRVTVDLFPHTNAALKAEVSAIRREFPLFNSRSSAHKIEGPFTEHSLNDHCFKHQPFNAGMEWNGMERKRRKEDGSVDHHLSVSIRLNEARFDDQNTSIGGVR